MAGLVSAGIGVLLGGTFVGVGATVGSRVLVDRGNASVGSGVRVGGTSGVIAGRGAVVAMTGGT